MTDPKDRARYECYLNIQRQDGSSSGGVIIFGNGETKEEAQALFDHALEAYREEKQ